MDIRETLLELINSETIRYSYMAGKSCRIGGFVLDVNRM